MALQVPIAPGTSRWAPQLCTEFPKTLPWSQGSPMPSGRSDDGAAPGGGSIARPAAAVGSPGHATAFKNGGPLVWRAHGGGPS